MPVIHLTEAGVRDLAPPATRTDYFDDWRASPQAVQGLCLRVTPLGHKSWSYVYRRPGSRALRRITLDAWPGLDLAGARKAARAAVRERARGLDPATSRQDARQALMFDDLADRYLAEYAKPRKRSWTDDARQLRVFCRPRWKHKRATDVTRADVRELYADVAGERSIVVANRLRACVSKVFRWAAAQGYLEQSPTIGLPALGRETPRERVLSDAEILTFWEALEAGVARWHAAQTAGRAAPADALSPTVRLWLVLRLLTGQRGGELAGLTWADVDLGAEQYEVPPSRYKTARPHVVPLAPWPRDLLTARRAERPHDVYVFEGGRGQAARMGLAAVFATLADFSPHDLRRTCATGMAKLGIPRFIVARVLGHVDNTVTATYDRYDALAEKRDALTKWSRHVARLVGETKYSAPEKVTKIRRRA